MDSGTFSTALFNALCDDFNINVRDFDRFDPSAELDPFGSADDWARRSLLCSILKKSEVETSPDADAVTLADFCRANEACADWEPPVTNDLAVGYSISEARRLLHDWFEPRCGTQLEVTMATIEREARFGPGRSVGLGDKPTSFYFKVGDATLTATSDFVRSWYNLSVEQNPLCREAELVRQAKHGEIEIVEAGNFTMVVKSYKKKRTVVTEASANTFFQLGMGAVMERVLEECTGFSPRNQASRNSELARIGSLNGRIATVDMKQCSDYIALGCVRYMYPKTVSEWISILRTKKVRIPGVGVIPLFMTSTMGNGTTFPMQTALLTAVVLGVYKTLDIEAIRFSDDRQGNYGVWGDDVALDQRAFNLFCKTVECLGLIVNRDKSFAEGPFRESCGHDWYLGRDVRGVYVKRYTTVQDLYSIYNRLSIWSARHSIPISKTLAFLLIEIAHREPSGLKIIPPDESIESGIIAPEPVEEPSADGLWEYDLYIPIVNPFRVDPWWDYKVWCESDEDRPRLVTNRWVKVLFSLAQGELNEQALLKSALFGALRRGKMSFRNKGDVLRYKVVKRVTPRWGFSPNPLMADLSSEQREWWIRSLVNLL